MFLLHISYRSTSSVTQHYLHNIIAQNSCPAFSVIYKNIYYHSLFLLVRIIWYICVCVVLIVIDFDELLFGFKLRTYILHQSFYLYLPYLQKKIRFHRILCVVSALHKKCSEVWYHLATVLLWCSYQHSAVLSGTRPYLQSVRHYGHLTVNSFNTNKHYSLLYISNWAICFINKRFLLILESKFLCEIYCESFKQTLCTTVSLFHRILCLILYIV